MDIETATNNRIEQELLHGEAAIARIRATQMVLLREVDRRQMPTASGCGSLGEWVRGRLDVAPETARDLVATAKHLEELPDVQDAVASGVIGFDRAVAVSRFAGRDDTFDILNEMAGFDIAGSRHRAAKRRRMRRVDEEVAFNDRYLTVQAEWSSAKHPEPLSPARSGGDAAERMLGRRGGSVGARNTTMRSVRECPWAEPPTEGVKQFHDPQSASGLEEATR